jgi:hypothetical protein
MYMSSGVVMLLEPKSMYSVIVGVVEPVTPTTVYVNGENENAVPVGVVAPELMLTVTTCDTVSPEVSVIRIASSQ